jgi:hypothetical protein
MQTYFFKILIFPHPSPHLHQDRHFVLGTQTSTFPESTPRWSLVSTLWCSRDPPQGLSCPRFVVSRVYHVQGLSCEGFVLSKVFHAYALSYPEMYICPGFVWMKTTADFSFTFNFHSDIKTFKGLILTDYLVGCPSSILVHTLGRRNQSRIDIMFSKI